MTRPNAEERKRKLREKAIEDTVEKIERAIASLDCLNKHYEGHYEIEAEQLKAMIRMLEWDLRTVKDSKSEREVKRLERKMDAKKKLKELREIKKVVLKELREIKKVVEKRINDPSIEFNVEDVNCVSLNYMDMQFTKLSKVNEDVKFVEGELKKRGYSFDPCVAFANTRYDPYDEWCSTFCLRWYHVESRKKK